MSDMWPEGTSEADTEALRALAAAGVGEGDFEGDEAGVPADLVQLYEVLEWENAVADRAGEPLPHPEVGVPPPIDPGTVNSTPLVSRAGWGARAPLSVTARNLTENTAHYGGPSPWPAGADRSSSARFAASTDHARCPAIVRAYQAFHMDQRGWQDIAYSSLVCPHRTRYEGRGKDVRTAANGTTTGNNVSHATCYIAGDGDPLTDGAKWAYLDEHVRLEGLDKVHSDWKSTACPGAPLRAWVKAGHPAPGPVAPPPPPPPPPDTEDDMLDIIAGDERPNEWYATDWLVKRQVAPADAALIAWQAARTGRKVGIDKDNRPFVVAQARVDAIPTAGDMLRDAFGHTGGSFPEGTDGAAAAQVRARAKEGAAQALAEG